MGDRDELQKRWRWDRRRDRHRPGDPVPGRRHQAVGLREPDAQLEAALGAEVGRFAIGWAPRAGLPDARATSSPDLGPQLTGMARRAKHGVLAPNAVDHGSAGDEVCPDFAAGSQRDGLAMESRRGPLRSAIAEAMVIGEGFEGREAFEGQQRGPNSEGDGWSDVGWHSNSNIDSRPPNLDYGRAWPISTV